MVSPKQESRNSNWVLLVGDKNSKRPLKFFLDTAFTGQTSTKWDSFIIAGIEFMFGLALVALNSKGPKLIKNPILVVWLGALYCAYFWIYKSSRGSYPYSPYHLMNDYYVQL